MLSCAAGPAVKRGERPPKKITTTLPELEALLATCGDSLEGIRDRALLCFGFASGGGRRGEIAIVDLSDLRRIGEAGNHYRQNGRLFPIWADGCEPDVRPLDGKAQKMRQGSAIMHRAA